jgi:hypothetical protein
MITRPLLRRGPYTTNFREKMAPGEGGEPRGRGRGGRTGKD